MHSQLTSRFEALIIASLVTTLTIGMAAVYPIWDDQRLLGFLPTYGVQAIQNNFGFRPLVAYMFAFLFTHRMLLPAALVFHWLGWMSVGVATIRLWRLMFPAYQQFAILPSMLAVAPVLCKVQLVGFTVVFICVIPCALSYGGVFLLLAAKPDSLAIRKFFFLIAGLSLIVLATMMSEYGALAAVVGTVLLVSRAFTTRRAERRWSCLQAALVAACALISYFIFLRIGTGSNPGFLPGYARQFLSWKIKVVPFRLLSGLWRGALGEFLNRLGSLTLNTKPALLSFVCGLSVSVVVYFAIRKMDISNNKDTANGGRAVVTILIAAAAVLIPVLLMDRTLESRWDSRFYLPLLPALSSLTVFILLRLLRGRALLVAIVCGFLAGYWTTFEIANTLRDRDIVTIEQRETRLATVFE